MATARKIGAISNKIIDLLSLSVDEGTPVYVSSGNVSHMKNKHPNDYSVYGAYISDIIQNPDYVGQNQKDGSIEYVKEFFVNNEYVKVAVRVSGTGRYFVRTLYVLNRNRVQNFINKGTLKKVNT